LPFFKLNVMKVCNKCNIKKPYSEFSRDKSRPGGYAYKCKLCCNKWFNQNYTIYKYIAKKLHYSIPPGVYKITCLINNKCYIGQSIQPYYIS
jgi:transposase-like protein